MNTVAYENLASSLKDLHERGNPFELARLAYSFLAGPLELDMFFNYMVVSPGADLWLSSYEGVPPVVARELANLPFGTAVCGSVAETATRQVFANVQQCPLPKTELIRSLGVQAYCCVPIISDLRLFGTVSFGSIRRKEFSETDVSLMMIVGDEIAKGLQQLLPRVEQVRSAVAEDAAVASEGLPDAGGRDAA